MRVVDKRRALRACDQWGASVWARWPWWGADRPPGRCRRRPAPARSADRRGTPPPARGPGAQTHSLPADSVSLCSCNTTDSAPWWPNWTLPTGAQTHSLPADSVSSCSCNMTDGAPWWPDWTPSIGAQTHSLLADSVSSCSCNTIDSAPWWPDWSPSPGDQTEPPWWQDWTLPPGDQTEHRPLVARLNTVPWWHTPARTQYRHRYQLIVSVANLIFFHVWWLK